MFQAPLHDIRISVDDLLERQARERPERTPSFNVSIPADC